MKCGKTKWFGSIGVQLAVVALLVGCSSKPPACEEESTISLIMSIIRKSVEDQGKQLEWEDGRVGKVFPLIPLNVSNITMEGYDTEANKYVCGGTLTATVPSLQFRPGDIGFPIRANILSATAGAVGLHTRLNNDGIFVIKGGTVELQVQFTSRVSSDGAKHLVTLVGSESVSDLIAALALISVDLVQPSVTSSPKVAINADTRPEVSRSDVSPPSVSSEPTQDGESGKSEIEVEAAGLEK